MSPIFVRPVREQLEHDRLIRLLQPKYQRKFDVVANIGDEKLSPVKIGPNLHYPDLVLWDGNKLACVVEVETGESVNNLEVMAQWTHFSHARVPFHLYVPVTMVDAARRLADAHHVHISELWTFRMVGEQFDIVRVFSNPSALAAATKQAPKAEKQTKPVIEKPVEKPAESPVEAPVPAVAVKKPVLPAAAVASKAPMAQESKKPAAKPTAGPKPELKKPAAKKPVSAKPVKKARPAAPARKPVGKKPTAVKRAKKQPAKKKPVTKPNPKPKKRK